MAADRPAPSPLVRVFHADPDLLRCVPAPLRERLERHATAEIVHLGVGLVPPEVFEHRDAFGLLVLDGLLARTVMLCSRRSVELLGGGDVVRPWQADDSLQASGGDSVWRALAPTSVAVLDDDLMRLVQRVPAVVGELAGRIVQRSHALAARLAIAQMPSLEARLLAVMWQLAERWGHVDRDGVVLALPLSHSTLADLVCAQRPSVSVALKHMTDRGQVVSLRPGWLLRERAA